MRKTSILCVLLASCWMSQAVAQAIVKDGGFEVPGIPPGSHVTYNLGQKLGAWTVVGPTGSNVDYISSTYMEAGFTFPARLGAAFVDLTGNPDRGLPQGVAQTVKTVPGTSYSLSFSVGNIYNPTGQGYRI